MRLSCCVVVSIDAAEDVASSALALADALQVVETSRLTLEARTRAGIEAGRNSEQELECLKAADFTPVRPLYAQALARLMTSAEMDEARAFLVTPLGRKIVQFVNAEHAKARGWQWPAAASLTDEEAAEAFKFLSPARARPSQSDAIRLVRAMREDEIFVAFLHQPTKADTRPMPQARRNCIESLKPADVTSAMVPAVQEHLSASEVKDAIGFYESEVGRKYTQLISDNFERPTELATS